MGNAQDLVRIIKKSAVESMNHSQITDVLFGTVTEVDPMVVETDQKLVLPEEFLVLCRDVTDYQMIISFDNESIKQRLKVYKSLETEPVKTPGSDPEVEREIEITLSHTNYNKDDNNGNEEDGRQPTRHTITVYNALKPGERVVMAKKRGGQRYFVIDREATNYNYL